MKDQELITGALFIENPSFDITVLSQAITLYYIDYIVKLMISKKMLVLRDDEINNISIDL